MTRRRPPSSLSRPLGELLAAVSLRDLKSAGLARCAGCAMAPFETVEEAVRLLGADPRRVGKVLAAALRAKGGR